MRTGDLDGVDYGVLRRDRPLPAARMMVEPGNLIIPGEPAALGAVAASSVVVTIYHPGSKRGGLCHFVRPRPEPGAASSPVYGLPAVLKLLSEFTGDGTLAGLLRVGVYGGACPPWADPAQRALARDNIDIARSVIEKKGAKICDQDVGGDRGRKLWFLTDSNEIAVVKTDGIRRSDWFPDLPTVGSRS